MAKRFQFRLRTLFIVVTLLAAPCAYVGWQEKIVREREAMSDPSNVLVFCTDVDQSEDIPLVRRWLGDQLYRSVVLSDAASDDMVSEYKMAFPEADVMRLSDVLKVSTRIEVDY
jgi:hypothetical protein